MSKKAKARNADSKNVEVGKVAMQVRLDADLHSDLHATAESLGVSVNQLIQAICRAALSAKHLGKPTRERGFLRCKPEGGCVMFGKPGNYEQGDLEHRPEWVVDKFGESLPKQDDGQLWFWLDFSERGNVHIPGE